ncbi:MAG TPA: hypothetical protein VK797_14920 [Tepidisphaeraceae bacterium]|nr:hypothetical protein [Tepidisphaeraceae bacterium]
MSKTITIELQDEVYETLRKIAERERTPLETLAIEWMAKYGPRPVPKRTPEERRRARESLLQFAGMHHGNDPHGSDNERIDADLVKESLDPHEPRP